MYRTGLAMEAANLTEGQHSTRVIRRRFGNTIVTDIRVGRADSRKLGKVAGRYITIEGNPTEHAVSLLLQKALEQLLPRDGLILAAGLGNPDIARDSLGSRTVRLLHGGTGKRALAAMETDVYSNTGIETVRMVRGVAAELNVRCVLAIDALACHDPLKIGRTVQVSDAGIQPGSGVCDNMPPLNNSFVGVPVVAVGVPMVSELAGLTGNPMHKGYLTAPPNEAELAQVWAEVIAGAINALTGI